MRSASVLRQFKATDAPSWGGLAVKAIADLRVADVMSSRIRSLPVTATLIEAAGLMAANRISCLLILEGGRLDGIVTERDMVRYAHQGIPPATPLAALMSTPVVTAPVTLDIRAAYELLGEHRVRHLVAVDAVGLAVGVVSETDFRTPLGREVFRSSRDLSAVMDAAPLALAPDRPLAEALAGMAAAPVDYALAVVDGRAIGILTERDVPPLIAQGVDVTTRTLAEVMSTPVASVAIDMTVVEALRRMDARGYRHMVVVDGDGRLAGTISQHRLLERLGLEIIEAAWRERDALEAERASIEGRLAMVLEMTGVGVWEYDYAANRFVWSSSVAEMLGLAATEQLPIDGGAWIALLHPDDHAAVLAARAAYESDTVFEAECRVKHARRGWLWVRYRGRVVVRDADGRAVRAAGTVVDISGQRAADKALDDERSRLRTLVDTLPDLVWLKDTEGVYLACNTLFETFVGLPESRIVGRSDADLLPAEQASFFREKDMAVIAAGRALVNEEWVTFADDGRRALLETTKSPVFDGEGRLIGVLGVGRDITVARRTQTALARRVQEVASLYEIFRETEKAEIALPVALRRVVSMLPGGVRHPECVSASLEFGGDTYGAAPDVAKAARFVVPFATAQGPGRLKVLRVWPAGSSQEEIDFDTDERAYLTAIAERVASAIDRVSESAALRDREEVFSAIVGQARDGISLVDTETLAFVEFNEAACNGLGYTREEFAKLTLADVQAVLTREQVQANVGAMLVSGGGELKVRHLRKDGSLRTTRVSSRVVIVRGRPYLALLWADISAQEAAEAELRQLRERFELAFQASPVAASIARVRGGIFVAVNDKYSRDFGWAREQLLGHSSVELGIWSDEHERDHWLEAMAVNGGVIDHPASWRDSAGRLRDVSLSSQIIEFDGEPHVLAYVVDITERRAAEHALRESERRFRSLFEEIPEIAVQGYDEQRRLVFWNSASERLYGYTEAEALGCLLEDLIIPPAVRADVIALHKAWLDDGVAIPAAELDLMRKDGSLVPVFSSHALLTRPDGGREMYCVDIDLSPLREAETRLRDSEATYRSLVAALAEGVMMLAADSTILTCNPRAQAILGRGAESLVGQQAFARDWGFLTPDGAPLPLETSPLAAVLAGGLAVSDYVAAYRHPDGRRRWLSINASPVAAVEKGRPAAAVLSLVDISARQEAEDALRKLSLAVEQSPNAVLVTDRRSRIEYVNQAFLRISGFTREQVIGHTPALWRSGETPAETYADMKKTLQAGEAWRGEFINLDREGNRRIDFVHVSPVRQPDGRVSHYLSIQEDITERKRTGEELDRHRHHLEDLVRERTLAFEAARDAAEAASRAKSAFLANMSHEIRTPMNAIIGLTHLLQREITEPRQREHLRKVSSSARHLLGIINDVLDISKIEADKVVLESRDFRIAGVFDDVVAMLAEQASAKSLALRVEIDPAVPSVLHGDALRLGQILLNFAGNAVKFTASGSVTLRALIVPTDASGEERGAGSGGVLLRCEVVDTGIGIDEAAQARLFQAFEQADTSTTRRFGGTGLGLAINKRLAVMMGGEVGFSSSPGSGSTFWFTARLGTAAGEVIEEGAAAEETPLSVDALERELATNHRGARVLLAEDNPVNREVALSLMADLGLHIDCAEDGAQAVAMAAAQPYDLILMDMQMPVLDGIDAARAIREAPGGTAVAIIALTANAFDEDRRRCLEAGMNGHVAKPVEPATLFAALRRWLPASASAEDAGGAAQSATSLAGHPAPGEAAAEGDSLLHRLRRLEGFDLAAGLHRLRGREASYIRLVGLFADGHRGDAERLQSVIAAGDLEEAGRLAHSLKGAAGMAGATAVQQAAACIEQALRETGRVDNALLEELAHGLDVLMACIDAGGFEGHAEGQGQEGAGRELATSSPEALARVLDEIEALLVDDDSAVNAVCVRHQALLQAACGAAGERLLRDVEHYDYESARTVLADMRAHVAR